MHLKDRIAFDSFWSEIRNHPAQLKSFKIPAHNLSQAARKAYLVEYSFPLRRGKEVFDLLDRFRLFQYRETFYICKRASLREARSEISNAKKAASLLKGEFLSNGLEVEVIVPQLIKLSANNYCIISADKGWTLHTLLSMGHLDKRASVPKKIGENILGLLLKKGIEWHGFAPRNIIFNKEDQKIYLIDWEKTYFHSKAWPFKSSTLFSYKIHLNSLYFREKSIAYITRKSLSRSTQKIALDSFEESYKNLLQKKKTKREIREICNRVSLQSEKPLSLPHYNSLSPNEFGHLISDIYSSPIDVFYSFLSAQFRQKYGDQAFSQYLHIATKAFQSSIQSHIRQLNPYIIDLAAIKRDIAPFLFLLFDSYSKKLYKKLSSASSLEEMNTHLMHSSCLPKEVLKIYKLEKKAGYKNTLDRSSSIDFFLDAVFRKIKKLFHIDKQTNLLLRGSASLGLVSVRSDIDFEVSSNTQRNGIKSIETLISSLLEIISLPSEGSEGRPTEKDITNYSLSRDLHEWLELRIPGNPCNNVGWLKKSLSKKAENLWKKDSLYETDIKGKLSAKIVFFEVKSLALKMANKGDIKFIQIEKLLYTLKRSYPSEIVHDLRKLIIEGLQLYEANITDLKQLRTFRNKVLSLKKKTL